jgi:hypothetical protein
VERISGDAMNASPNFDDEVNRALRAREVARQGQQRSQREMERRSQRARPAQAERSRPEQKRLAAEQARQRARANAEAQRIAAAYEWIDERLQADAAHAVKYLRKKRLRPERKFPPGPDIAQMRAQKGWVLASRINEWDHVQTRPEWPDSSTITSTSTPKIRVRGVMLSTSGHFYIFDTGGQNRYRYEAKSMYAAVENPLTYYLTAPLTSALLLRYPSSDALIAADPIADTGKAVISVDDEPAVDKLLGIWHQKLVDLATKLTWNSRG